MPNTYNMSKYRIEIQLKRSILRNGKVKEVKKTASQLRSCWDGNDEA